MPGKASARVLGALNPARQKNKCGRRFIKLSSSNLVHRWNYRQETHQRKGLAGGGRNGADQAVSNAECAAGNELSHFRPADRRGAGDDRGRAGICPRVDSCRNASSAEGFANRKEGDEVEDLRDGFTGMLTWNRYAFQSGNSSAQPNT